MTITPGVIHTIYYVRNRKTGKCITHLNSIYPSQAEFMVWAANRNRGEDLYEVAVWTQERELRYASPVGTDAERATGEFWPGDWIDANGYARWYYTGSHWAWHTGADLNLNEPAFDADAHAPLYSIGDGTVYAIRKYPGWDWVLCIEHADCLSRYAHIENVQVNEGATVQMGTHIANIGDAGGNYPYHLHFDITRLDARMRDYPGDWPREDKERVLNQYYDPLVWLREINS